MIGPDAAERRVLGCLIEKQRTTPDAYPLSLNALRLAANQTTARDPVVDYGEDTLRDAIARLVRRGWARLASGPGSRATKYRHLLDDALSLDARELSLLAVLMLRGAQTPGELRQRAERLYAFATATELEAVLERLAERRLIVRHERRPGQKEARWGLGEAFGDAAEPPQAEPATYRGGEPPPAALPPTPSESDGLTTRVATIEAELAELRSVVAQLRELLDSGS
jgi:uncharacterized protein YceH (UPF0502 family)